VAKYIQLVVRRFVDNLTKRHESKDFSCHALLRLRILNRFQDEGSSQKGQESDINNLKFFFLEMTFFDMSPMLPMSPTPRGRALTKYQKPV
jgi:hypothetical protein